MERDFCKLTNNSNLRYDSRNNVVDCFFQPIYDGIEEISYSKRYQNVFYRDIRELVSTGMLQRQIKEELLNKLSALNPHGEYYKARKNPLEIKKRS